MANGTSSILASVWARRVFPQPVGPMSRMLAFCKAERPVARHSRFTPARRACLAVTGDMDLLPGLHDVIDQPVLFRRLRIHPEVPFGVVFQALNRLPRMLG